MNVYSIIIFFVSRSSFATTSSALTEKLDMILNEIQAIKEVVAMEKVTSIELDNKRSPAEIDASLNAITI